MFRQTSRPQAALAALLLVFSNAAAADDGTWEVKRSMTHAAVFTASGVIGGKLYVAGGSPPPPALQIYDPTTDTWGAGQRMPLDRCAAASGVIDGKLYVAGGMFSCDSSRTTNILEVYDPIADRWETKEPMLTARQSMAGGVVDGKLYVIGGMQRCAPCISMTTVEVYDPVTDKWQSRASMPTARSHHGAAVIGGKIYVAGGQNVGFVGDRGREVAALEVYDPVADTWETKAPMLTPRLLMGVNALDGRVHAVGGQNLSGTLFTTNEAYDPASDAWESDAPAPTRAFWAPSAQAIGAKLYVAGAMENGSITGKLGAFTNGILRQASFLIAVVNDLRIPEGIAKSLAAKLRNALAALEAGRTTTACNVLSAFIHEVDAQSGKHIAGSDADQLAAAAEQIRAAQGCR